MMLRKFFLVPAVVTAIAAPSALAQTASDTDSADVAINGYVSPLCILGEPTPATVDLGQLIETSGARVGRIRTIPAQDVNLPDSFCNFAGSTVSISASALLSAGTTTPPSGFARAVNFTATASGWASGDSSATTAASADGSTPTASGSGGTQPLPNLADIGVQLAGFTVPGDALLVADTYSGLVTVTLGPAALAN